MKLWPRQLCGQGLKSKNKPRAHTPKSSDKSMNESTPEFKCPLCAGPMTVTSDASGVTVRCNNPCDPQCHENAFGHGKDAKEAYSVAGQKYKPRGGQPYRPMVIPVVTIAPEAPSNVILGAVEAKLPEHNLT